MKEKWKATYKFRADWTRGADTFAKAGALSSADIRVGLGLLSFADEHGVCFPSAAKLMAAIPGKIGEATLYKAYKAMEANGLLERQQRRFYKYVTRNGRVERLFLQASNIFRLKIPKSLAINPQKVIMQAALKAKRAAQMARNFGEKSKQAVADLFARPDYRASRPEPCSSISDVETEQISAPRTPAAPVNHRLLKGLARLKAGVMRSGDAAKGSFG